MPDYLKYKLIAFDLDGTLAESKSAISDEMAKLLGRLLEQYQVAVTSGGKFTQFKKQLIERLKLDSALLKNLHILPTNAASYFHYNPNSSKWEKVFANTLTLKERKKIISTIRQAAKSLGFWEARHYGKIIEDRDSQITFSALGQDVVDKLGEQGLELKARWDPDGSKKSQLRDAIAKKLPEFSVASAGMTSVDVMGRGMDKARGLLKLIKQLGIDKTEVLYIGDALYHGGNDAIVKEAGFNTLQVGSPSETAIHIEKLLQG